MQRTLHERRDSRSKQAPESRVEGGRPVHPMISHLEGHIEQLFAVEEDATFFERGAHVEILIAKAIDHCEQIFDSAKTFADAIEASHIQRRVVTVAQRLAKEQRSRALRLRNVVAPAVRECYLHGEAQYEHANA